eukprot:TRINITY_DN4131_c0_g1_i1.p1 TRINITY_DN4131_c0_g1~~TRINITY_DN4131_c0_g1_i1.p1  ORF type:complete len:673 (-),score=169.38 TRINITY_DN4131_c0_g1_i1:16-2034(-)
MAASLGVSTPLSTSHSSSSITNSGNHLRPSLNVVPSVSDDRNKLDAIRKEWTVSPEGKKYISELAKQDTEGILNVPVLPASAMSDVREVKVLIVGKNASGKTATVHNLCSREIPSAYTESSGIQVFGTYWPVQLRNSRIVILKYKFWDAGFNASKKYNYLSDAMSDPKAIIYVFSITDRDSFEEIQRQIVEHKDMKAVKIIVGTKNDNFLQTQVTRFELADLSQKYKLPVYMIKNLRESTPQQASQNEKDIAKIKNDVADYLLSEGDWEKRVRLYQSQSRFKVTERKVNPIANPMRGLSGTSENHGEQPKKGPQLVSKGLPGYEMVYDMITGIQHAVVELSTVRASREEEMNLHYAIPQIVLLPKDFTAVQRYAFTTSGVKSLDSENPELLSHRYEYPFKFTDHSPFVFSNIRATFGLSTASYLTSLTESNSLYELKSPGKSDSFFYFSLDFRYLLKTVNDEEAEFFRNFLRNYYQFMANNPNTLLCKFYGLYSIQPSSHSKEMHFVVMENAFPPEYTMFERYDLKGSTVGRYATTEEKRSDKAILKDLDIRRSIAVGDHTKKLILEQLEKDTKLLSDNNVMDYSFLFGVARPLESDPKLEMKDKSFSSGGLPSKDGEEIYFFSVIDIFQEWNMRKKMENQLKSLIHDHTEISAVNPELYRERFLKFLRALF